MKSRFRVGNIIQFVNGHHWEGCIGIVEEIKEFDDDCRLLIAVQVPHEYTAYIYALESKNQLELCGNALIIPGLEEDE